MHDRPVLGGNASSEIRMWVCGARGENMRETGIIEEIELENLFRNPQKNYSLWDALLYEKVRFEPNITLLLNCSCNDCSMEGDRIASVKGWQLTTETWHTVSAKLFADCSGDSILAPLSGAEFRMGREARSEFDESAEPEVADKKTMGMSCLIQMRETDGPKPFIPPPWAYKYLTDEDLPNRNHRIGRQNFWWLEFGGTRHTIYDTEEIRDELLKIAFGVWDHIKNHGDHNADNWVLDWIGFLPGKRESRRYVGDHVITQKDVESGGKFEDIVAYGGWTMDDHDPDGMNYPGPPTTHYAAPSPWGIPYRSLYSKNILNLFCAGRNISASHIALSSSRVMRTCSTIGQAVGTAAFVAVKKAISPREVYPRHIDELQQMLLSDDCYLPGIRRNIPTLTAEAHLGASDGNPEPLRNGVDRPVGNTFHGWKGTVNGWVEYRFDTPKRIRWSRLVFDSDLGRDKRAHRQPCYYPLNSEPAVLAESLVKSFRLEVRDERGEWNIVHENNDNYQRLVTVELDTVTTAVRFVPTATRGSELAHLFSWDIE